MSSAVCPGSFDPITRGHLFVIEACADRFDDVVVTVVVNPAKSGMFSIDERVELIQRCVAHLSTVRVDRWQGLLVDHVRAQGMSTVVKGLRSSVDLEYEAPMAQMNREMAGVETVFLLTDPRYAHVSSSLVKQIAGLGGDISPYVPDPVAAAVTAKLAPGG